MAKNSKKFQIWTQIWIELEYEFNGKFLYVLLSGTKWIGSGWASHLQYQQNHYYEQRTRNEQLLNTKEFACMFVQRMLNGNEIRFEILPFLMNGPIPTHCLLAIVRSFEYRLSLL